MTITAKYAGKCTVCGHSILVGAQIEWKKGEGSKHAGCAGKAATVPTRREPLSLDGRPAIRDQHWSQRGTGPEVRLCAGGCGRRVGSRYAECYSCHQESVEAM